MVNDRKRIKIEFMKKDDNEKIIKQQSKPTFNRVHKSFTTYVSYAFKQNEVLMYKPICVGFAVLDLRNLCMRHYEFQPYFGEKNIQLPHIDCHVWIALYSTLELKILLTI